MDALEVLRQMHVEAKETFAKIEQADPGSRGGLWAKLRPELQLHEQIEERFVYDPVAQEAGSTNSQISAFHQQHETEVKQEIYQALGWKIARLFYKWKPEHEEPSGFVAN